MSSVTKNNKTYIRGFDGLRAISIILVLLDHLGVYNILRTPTNKSFIELISGNAGVTIFFCISGFLITSLLIKEKQTKKFISIKNFIARRALRILPPYITFIIAAIILKYLGQIQFDSIAIFLSAVYAYNFIPRHFSTPELAHLWSLAVEEQFYLTWPLVMKFFKGINFYILFLIIYVFGFYFSEWSSNHQQIRETYIVNRWFFPAALPIMTGSLFANLNNDIFKHHKAFFTRYSILIVAITIYVLSPFIGFKNYSAFIQSIGISLTLTWLLYNQHSIIAAVLEQKVISFIGKISYGLYIWQGLFLTNGPTGELFIQKFPVNIGLTFVVAIISYYTIEKKCLSYKHRFN